MNMAIGMALYMALSEELNMDAIRALWWCTERSRGRHPPRSPGPSTVLNWGFMVPRFTRRARPISAAVRKTRFLLRHSVSGNDPPWHRMVGVEQAESTPPPRRLRQQEN